MNNQSCDYLIVGAGPAGCVLAARLSEDPGTNVILLEAGGPDRSPLFRIPALSFTVLTPQYNWIFETEPIAGLNDRRLKVNYGKVVGGSSSINGMQFSRGHSSEYDAWQAMGCAGWGFDDVLPFFKKLENNVRGAGPWHGSDGPMPVRRADPRLSICDAFLSASRSAGFPVVDDINADHPEAFGYVDVNIRRGRRVSAASAYLHPAKRRPNLTVLTNAQAVRIVVEKGRARGVEILRGNQREIIRCDGEVIVSAGAVKSPQLLMLSGIGPAEHLRGIGIPLQVDAPRVGQDFQNHTSYNLQYACSGTTTSFKYLRPKNALGAGLRYLAYGTGALGESMGALAGFFRSDPALDVADVHFSLLTSLIIGSLTIASASSRKLRFWDFLPKQDGFTCAVHSTSYSRGEIRLRSTDPLDDPLIMPNYFSDARDMKTMLAAVSKVRDIARGDALRSYITHELKPGPAISDAPALEAAIRQNASHSFHPCGTCAMGGDATSVVDPELRVRGIDGLRVADASIIPKILNSGLHAAAIMIGEKAASMIRSSASATRVA